MLVDSCLYFCLMSSNLICKGQPENGRPRNLDIRNAGTGRWGDSPSLMQQEIRWSSMSLPNLVSIFMQNCRWKPYSIAQENLLTTWSASLLWCGSLFLQKKSKPLKDLFIITQKRNIYEILVSWGGKIVSLFPLEQIDKRLMIAIECWGNF